VTPPLEYSAPAAEDLLGEGWFGEGSVFDTGEELAGALMALAGGKVAWPIVSPQAASSLAASEPAPPAVDAGQVIPGPARAGPPADSFGEFQVATMPRGPGAEPSGWAERSPAPFSRRLGAAPRSERGGWSIRQSVQFLRLTEEILYRLREEAAQLTWQLAAATHRETDPPKG